MSYRIRITEEERRSLAWLADRYEAARVLYDHLERDADNDLGEQAAYLLPEYRAWQFAEAYAHGDGGNPNQIPCCSGPLADKIEALWGAIV